MITQNYVNSYIGKQSERVSFLTTGSFTTNDLLIASIQKMDNQSCYKRILY